MAAPTFVAEYESAWNDGNTPKTSSVTVAAGDVLVIVGMSEDSSYTLNTPTGGSLTYTLQQSIVVSSNCTAYIWTAPAASGQTFTLSLTSSGGGGYWGFNCLRFSGSDGIGASSKTNSTGAPSLALTTGQANSAIVTCVSDWSAADGSSRTWRTINSLTPTSGNGMERTYFRDASRYTAYAAYWSDAGAAGSKTTGLSAPTGLTYAIISVEVLGTTGSAPNEGSAALSVSTALAASGRRDSSGTSAITTSVAVSATGRTDRAGSAALSVGTSLSVTGARVSEGSTALSVSVSLAATGVAPTGAAEGTAAIAIGVAVAAAGAIEHTGMASLGVGVSLAASGATSAQGSAAIATSVSIAASGAIGHSGTAAIPVATAISAFGSAPGVDSSMGNAAIGFTVGIAATGAALSRIIPVRVLTAQQILTGNRNTKFYLDILDSNDSPVARLNGLTDGKLDWIANASVKGAGSLTVIDVDQEIDWLTARFRPVMLIKGLPPQPLGVFISAEAPDSFGNGRSWAVKLLDKTTILHQDTVSETYALAAGTVATNAIVTLIESAGLTRHAVTPSAATLPGAMVWSAGTKKLKIINELLSLIGYFSLYCNFDGQMVGQPYVLPAKRPLVYEFIDGPKSIYERQFTRDADFWNIPNRVTAVGIGDGTTAALTSTVDNTDPDSSYSIANRGRVIGHEETGVEAADQAALDAYARRRLIELTSPTSSIEINHAPVPGLTINQAARFRRQPAGIDARHVVTQTSLTLKGNALATSTLREVVDL